MEIVQLKDLLSDRLGRPVRYLQLMDGSPAESIEQLYEPSPAGFQGRLVLNDGSVQVWNLWQEDNETWNFFSRCLDEA